MTQITGNPGPAAGTSAARPAAPAAPAAPGPQVPTDTRSAAKDAPPTDVARAL
jgi:hypothetical protein